jgi:UDP-N-acetylmuramoylalanine--D-glutamate ligase
MQHRTQTIQKALENKLVVARKENMRRLGNVEHRLEFVDEVNGVEFINDAKATDINSSWYSVDCMEKPVVWIAGSSHLETDLELFSELDAAKIKALIVMGNAQENVMRAFENRIDLIGRVNTMNEAVAHAILISNEGDAVLFSPACSDYETFKHFKDAGQQFRKAVRETRL